MAFCTQCGQPQSEVDKFCTSCGSPQQTDVFDPTPLISAMSDDAPVVSYTGASQFTANEPPVAEVSVPDEVDDEPVTEEAGVEPPQVPVTYFDVAASDDVTTPVNVASFCTNCGAQLSETGAFCMSCGAPRQGSTASERPFLVGAGVAMSTYRAISSGATIGTALPSDSTRPAELWASIGVIATGAALVFIYSAIAIKDLVPGLSSGGGFLSIAFFLFALLIVLVFASFGVAMAATAWLLYTGDQVGRWLGIALCAAVAFGSFLATGHTGTEVAAGVVALVGAVMLFAPRTQAYFAAEDDRSIGVVFTSVLIAFFAWSFFVTAMACYVADRFQRSDLVYGTVFLAGAVGLLFVNRFLHRGSEPARVVASILFLVLGIFALVLSLNSASTLVEAALCVAGIFALWGPASSQAHFAGEVEAESSAGMRWRSPSGAMSSTAVPATGSRATSATVAAVIAVAAFVGGASNAFASNPYNSAFTVPLTTRTTTPVALPARSSRCPRAWDDPGKRLKARKA